MANRKLKSLKFPGIDDTYILDAGNVNYSDEETYEEGSVGEGLNALKEDIDDLGFSVVNGKLCVTYTE